MKEMDLVVSIKLVDERPTINGANKMIKTNIYC